MKSSHPVAPELANLPLGTLIPDGQQISVRDGLMWLSHGWAIFKKAPATWLSISAVYVVLTFYFAVTLVFIPPVVLMLPVFIGGIVLGCRALDQGEELNIQHLFAGFVRHLGDLLVIGALGLMGLLAILFVFLFLGALIVGTDFRPQNIFEAMVLLLLLFGAIAMVTLMVMALWFAPPLVTLHDMAAMDAMKSSFRATIKNWKPFLCFGLLVAVLSTLASAPFFLGWLILSPVMFGAGYTAYRDIFIRHDENII